MRYIFIAWFERRILETVQAVAQAIWPLDSGTTHIAGFYEGVAETAMSIAKRYLMIKDFIELCCVLFVMSTRLGSAFVSSGASLSMRYPFALTFTELPRATRERVLLQLSRSWLSINRKAFGAIKKIVSFALLAHSDGQQDNQLWSVMGYTPPHKLRGDTAACQKSIKAELTLQHGVLDVFQFLKQRESWSLVSWLRASGISSRDPSPADAELAGLAPDQLAAVVDCDVAVVGTGAGGGPAAAVLAGAGLRVLVLEKGFWAKREELPMSEREGMEIMERGGLLTTADAAMAVLAGSTLGGGTKVNWCASLRTPQHVLQEWSSRFGLPLFTCGAFTSSLDAVCARQEVAPAAGHSRASRLLWEGLRAVGASPEPMPRNCASATCSTYCVLGCRDGQRRSADTTWLADAVAAGARVLTRARAERVITGA